MTNAYLLLKVSTNRQVLQVHLVAKILMAFLGLMVLLVLMALLVLVVFLVLMAPWVYVVVWTL